MFCQSDFDNKIIRCLLGNAAYVKDRLSSHTGNRWVTLVYSCKRCYQLFIFNVFPILSSVMSTLEVYPQSLIIQLD